MWYRARDDPEGSGTLMLGQTPAEFLYGSIAVSYLSGHLRLIVVLTAMPCLARMCGALAKFQISGDLSSGVVFALSDLPPKGRTLAGERACRRGGWR